MKSFSKIKKLEIITLSLTVLVAISLLVVGIINIRDVFPEDLFYTPDRFGDTGKYFLAGFIRQTMLFGMPRQESYVAFASYFNVFPVQLIIYGSLLLLNLVFNHIIKERMTLHFLLFIMMCLFLYLFSTTILFTPFPTMTYKEAMIYRFDFVYSLVIIAVVVVLIILLFYIGHHKYSKIYVKRKTCVISFISCIVLDTILFFEWIVASLKALSGSLYQNSEFVSVVCRYGKNIDAQKFFICPSILYCMIVVLNIYLVVSVVLYFKNNRGPLQE